MTATFEYSAICRAMRPSPIRELFKFTQRPGMISFAGGLPDPAIFPVTEFAECSDALAEHGATALQYGPTEGYAGLVATVQELMERPLGRTLSPAEILIASGSQQVMDLLSRVLIDPGDVVVVEAPTYPGALHTFRNVGARFATVPCDADGMKVDLLPEVIERCRAEVGRLPKFVYSITNFSNPSGTCLAADRRRRLLEVATRWNIPVFEDDPYGELRYSGTQLPTVFSLTEWSGVLYASSFSKILAPGVRVAWAVGDRGLIRSMAIAKQGADLCTSMVTQVLVAEYCRRGHLESHLEKIRAHYARKAASMARALHRHLPPDAAEWNDPDGGFFFWLRLTGGRSRALFDRGIEKGVAFLPGDAFFPAPDETVGTYRDGSGFARLCFTFAGDDEIDEGCRRLAVAMSPP
jgi:2-aminoadipate transaminase